MTFFLNPRVLVTLALVAALAFSHLIAFRKGRQDVRNEWLAATAAASSEARRLEQARQRRADESAAVAAAREVRNRAAAARVVDERDGLRDALDTARARGAKSLDACREHTATLEAVFGQCGRQLQDVAREADGHASDSLKLQGAWPE